MKVKCHQCHVLVINSTPYHETGCHGHFIFTKDKRTYLKYTVWLLDVLGNIKDGFEVNDRSKLGSILVPEDCPDKTILKALKARDWLHNFSRFKSFSIDDSLHVNWKNTNEPMFQLEVI